MGEKGVFLQSQQQDRPTWVDLDDSFLPLLLEQQNGSVHGHRDTTKQHLFLPQCKNGLSPDYFFGGEDR